MYNLTYFINALKEQRFRLDAAIHSLEQVRPPRRQSAPKRRGRKPRRLMSAAAKKRISAGMKARWAKAKRAGSNSLSSQ